MFNVVWNHFVVQGGAPSMDEIGYCRYRGLNGSKCALGLFIPDDRYTTDLEGDTISEILEKLGDDLFDLQDVSNNFVFTLQQSHDRAALDARVFNKSFSAEIKARLIRLARAGELLIPEGN